jgi:hypothetical protein
MQLGLTNNTTWMCVRPGAKLSQLRQSAHQVLQNAKKQGKATGHVYYLAGIPDLTTKIRGEDCYQEVVYMGTPSETVPLLETELIATAKMTQEMGWTPVFCTISPMSLKDWNSSARTPYLLHHNQYGDMQALLENTVIAANHVIRSLNKSNRVYTPNLQRQIAKISHGKVKFMYNRLYDGCHPCASVVDEWVKIMKQAMTINDQKMAQIPAETTRTPIQERCIGFPVDDSDSDSDIETSHKRRW